MIIGVPREKKILEKRVGLTPSGAAVLVGYGHHVIIEDGAGTGSGFSNQDYSSAGAEISESPADVWNKSDVIVKVKEPHASEYAFFRPDLTVFDFLHLASLPDLTKKLVDSGMTSIAYELVQTSDMRLPLLEPMSAIAGRLAVLNGAYFLQSQHAGSGVLLGGLGNGDGGSVVVLGCGVAGSNACALASAMGAKVTVLDRKQSRLDEINAQCGGKLQTVLSSEQSVRDAVLSADLLIGAVLVPGAEPPKIVSRELVSKMRAGSVIVDISVDQGGCIETIRPTDLETPTYIENNVIHYGVCNMPSQTPRTATSELTKVTLPWIIELANHGLAKVAQDRAEIRNAIATYKGNLCTQSTGESLSMRYKKISELLMQS